MDRQTYPVSMSIGNVTKTYSSEFQTSAAYADAWKRTLLAAHGKAVVRCLCAGEGDKRLSVHSRAHSDRFHLARFPDTGPQHADDCVYYGLDPTSSGLSAYRKGVVEELDDGTTKIKLRVGLEHKPTSAPEEDAPKPAIAAKPRKQAGGQAAMTLLGLLHLLWTTAGFHQWAPAMLGKRNLATLHHHLIQAALRTYAGRVRLASNLLVATPSNSGRQAELNQAKSVEAMNRRRRLVVIAPLARYQPGSEVNPTLPISGFHGIPHLSMPPEAWETAQTRFRSELNSWMTGTDVVAIAQTAVPTPSRGAVKADLVDLALMVVTPHWIPVDSAYEAAVAAALVEECRRFEKPLRFDADDKTFPDFWLRDCGEPLPMEVWGLSDPEYLARKAEKSAHYNDVYGADRWWQWDATTGDTFPPFPSPSTRPAGSPTADSITLAGQSHHE